MLKIDQWTSKLADWANRARTVYVPSPPKCEKCLKNVHAASYIFRFRDSQTGRSFSRRVEKDFFQPEEVDEPPWVNRASTVTRFTARGVCNTAYALILNQT